MHAENDLVVTKQSDSLFFKTVEYALESGKPILIENVGEHLVPPILDLLKSYS